jgi:hypothetical protein
MFPQSPGNLRRGLVWHGLAFALLLSVAAAQQPTPVAPAAPEPTATGTDEPLGTMVRNSKKQSAMRAKKVITEDDMDGLANKLPRIRMDAAENSDEIVAAIGEYKQSHTPEETEAAIQAW